MAFDQTTRNRLARFVSDARALLSEEFTRQLQNEYGLDPTSGDVTPIDRLTAVDDRRRETAKILRETLDYYLAGNTNINGKANQDVLDRIVREQAFTVLNRLCALRMSEARGLVLESIAKGYESKGFQLYARLAGSALGETGEAYRMYLFSLMDEFAVDLPVLFDRFSPQGRLFPREATLLKLLQLINDAEIDSLWSEDETIGWIYQYFNSKEERKAMRDASQAPRNSRELAVRNQFFTPRYVVEFLTDNTLGRIWYEMTKGETALKDTCRYLVRRPTEIFLNEGEEAPEQTETDQNLSQEDLLHQPEYIPHRPLKDPREIKMLDPACGSMHFGLYAFDLFEQIYAEAWELEERLGEDALQRLADLGPLHNIYPDKQTYLIDVPRLIIERNVHGIDIDPRAVQIAGLSLWLRAQKSWQAQGLRPSERPQIRKSNVVCAEPMPGDRQMLEEFLGNLRGDGLEALMRKAWHVPADQKVRATQQMADALAKLVRTLWNEMELAGEAGSLLKIEETMRDAIATARKEAEEKSPLFRVLEYGINETLKGQSVQLISGEDQDFFNRAEVLVLTALNDYAEQAMNGVNYRRHLFIGNAVQGFEFIDICRKRYDVILMNPPYGSASEATKPMLAELYPSSWIEIYICFCERMLGLSANGFIGALTSRTWMYLQKFIRFRKSILTNQLITYLVDLGSGVLDDAAVETSAWVYRQGGAVTSNAVFINVNNMDNKEDYLKINTQTTFRLRANNRTFIRDQTSFINANNSSISYIRELTEIITVAGKSFYDAKPGLSTHDDYRFARLRWEVPSSGLLDRSWICGIFGGQACKFYADHNMVLNWKFNGAEMKAYIAHNYGSASRGIRNEEMFFKSGLTYQYTGNSFRVHTLPKGTIITMAGHGLFPKPGVDEFALLGLLNTDSATKSLKEINPGRFFQSGYVNSIQVSPNWKEEESNFSELTKEIYAAQRSLGSLNENSTFFQLTNVQFDFHSISEKKKVLQGIINEKLQLLNKLAEPYFAVTPSDSYSTDDTDSNFSDMPLLVRDILSIIIGLLFGRWDVRHEISKKNECETTDPFKFLPICPPAMLQNEKGLPANPGDIPAGYPFRISWVGILQDDKGGPEDIELRVREVMRVIWQERSDLIEQEFCQILETPIIRDYFKKPSGFFDDHLRNYSKNRRVAPIYWQISTPSCSYTLWLYYHRLNDQTLYTCVNDFVDPKLKQVSEEAAHLRLKKGRSAADEKELERLTDFERELKDFREELLRVAKFWKPNLNDGVEITAAPLWKLFQHKPWQKRLKETWQKLEAGEYDWAHLAYSIWPERVREKCKSDKSLAIAHDLEELYVEPPASNKKKKTKKPVIDEETEGWFNDN